MGRKRPVGLNLILLCGGDSSEREVSLRSGAQVARALRDAAHSVEVVDPAETDLASIDWRTFDACFLALHGGEGEDGRLQAWLDERGVAYTGSGSEASRLAMSKSLAKQAFCRAGVPTPPSSRILADEPLAAIEGKVGRLGFPLVFKPDGQGSSLGVGVAHSADEVAACLALARQFEPLVLAERFVRGRELTVAVLGRRPLPLLEVVAGDEVFDYQSKYNSKATEYRFETGLPPMKIEEVRQTAVAAATALDTAGLVRVDLMLDEQQQPWVLEINTLPGMTDRSMAPRAALEAGVDMPTLCDWMVREAIERRAWQRRWGGPPPLGAAWRSEAA